jgi:hypothetical protein
MCFSRLTPQIACPCLRDAREDTLHRIELASATYRFSSFHALRLRVLGTISRKMLRKVIQLKNVLKSGAIQPPGRAFPKSRKPCSFS